MNFSRFFSVIKNQLSLFILIVLLAFSITITYSYADSLSTIKNSLQKGQIESNTSEQTKENFNSNSETLVKENIKNKVLPKKQPIKKNAPKKLSRITDISYSPKRISETLPIKTFVATPLPTDSELLSIDSSENKLIFIKKIKDMHNELVTQDYYYLKDYLDEILRYGNKYPDICALARLYYIEGEIKKLREPNYPDGPATSLAVDDLEKELLLQKMLEEIADTYSQGKKDIYKTCQYVVNKISDSSGWLAILNQNSQKRKEIVSIDIKARLESITYYKNELNEYETYHYTYYNKPNRYKIENRCNDIISSYTAIIHSYLILKNVNETQKYLSELNTFYNLIKSEYTVLYKESYDSNEILKEKIQIKKDPNNFIKTSVEYYNTLFNSQIDSINYEELNNELKLLSEYCDEVPHKTVIDNKTVDIEYDFNDMGIKQSAKMLHNKMSLPLEVYRLFFMKYDKYCSTYNGDVLSPESTIVLKLETNRPLTTSIVQCNIKSLISKQTKALSLQRSSLTDSYEYYATFIPNDTKSISGKSINLINNASDAFKESISYARCENFLPAPLPEYNNNFFASKLGSADFDIDIINAQKADYKISPSFLKSGGVEKLQAEFNNAFEFVLVKNQADWFVISGHGNIKTGTIGQYVGIDNEPLLLSPSNQTTEYYLADGNTSQERAIAVQPLINEDGSSEFQEDIDILILAACDCIGSPKAIKAWRKALGSEGVKIILGYKNKVFAHVPYNVLNEMNKLLNSNNKISNDELIKAWANEHRKYYKKITNFPNSSIPNPFTSFLYGYMWGGAYNWAYIDNDVFHHSRFNKLIGPLSSLVFPVLKDQESDEEEIYLSEFSDSSEAIE